MIRHYLRMFGRTFALSTSTLLVYRANIVFFLIFESVFFVAQFLSVSIGYDLAGGHDIVGWTREQAYLLTAVSSLSHQIFLCFFIGPIFQVSGQVWSGQYDYILLKPLHPLASMWFNGQFIVSNMPNLLLCIGAVGYFVVHSGTPWHWAQLPLFVVMIGLGVGVRIGLALLCMAPVFFSERMAGIDESFWSLASLGRYQMEIYPMALRMVFIFALPVAMMAALPATVLTRPFDYGFMGLAVLSGAGFLLFSAWVFLRCLRRYQSVNSGV